MNSISLPSSPCPHRAKFTRIFLRALARINKKKPTSSSYQEISKRSRRIKIAAYASMASAVGSRRAWSRVMLWKLRSRTRYRALIRSRLIGSERKRIVDTNPTRSFGKPKFHATNPKTTRMRELSRANKLRQLVPGGEAMDFSNLLDEASHYIKCLTTQVQVMQSIADFYST